MNKLAKILGVAFLLQFVTSFGNGVLVKSALINPDDISETMVNIAGQVGLMQTFILVDMVTALGIIFLGAMLYITLRDTS